MITPTKISMDMKALFQRHIMAAVLTAVTGSATAQELRSAYFTQDYKFRHDLNAAFGNDQNYIAFPALGNLNVSMQGNFGLCDVMFQNPQTGKYDLTFMHPDVPVSDALDGFNKNVNRLQASVGVSVLSFGFKGFGGYNTFEVNAKATVSVNLPYDLLEFAKNSENKSYVFDDFGARGNAYTEIAFGHSHPINDKLRIGAKLKVLLGAAHADLTVKNLRANLTGDTWTLTSGETKAEVNMKGIEFKNTTDKTYKDGRPDIHVDLGETDVDGSGIGGLGFGVDLGGVYEVMDGLKVSAALNDLGFIHWNNNHLLTAKSKSFTFDGFHDIAVRNTGNDPNSLENQSDRYVDQLSDFVNLKNEGDKGSKSTMLAATAVVGGEYTLQDYKPLSFGLMAMHRFDGDYSWNEARLSANWTPLNWLNGGVNVAINTFAASAGWVLNIHPNAFNFYIGMDHILGKQSKEGVPLSSNASVNVGMSIAF